MIMFIFARSLSGGFSVMVLYRVLRHQQREYEREYWYLRYSAWMENDFEIQENFKRI